MEFYLESNNDYTLAIDGNRYTLKPYELLTLAQQVINEQYPGIYLDIEATLKEKEARVRLYREKYSRVSLEEATEIYEANDKVYKYSVNTEKMVLLVDNDFPLNKLLEGEYYVE